MASWQQVKEVLDAALDLPAGERPAFLAATCGDDGELRREVEALLELEDHSGEFLTEPIFRLHGEPEDDPNLGRLVGSFRLLRRLADGGMGAVYLAERADGRFEQRAAVKLIKRGMDSEEIVRRFEAERQILAHLSHDSIAKLLDGGTTEDGLPFFALELVEGVPFDRYCEEKRLTLPERIDLFLAVCDAVAFAHRNLVIHRDLKPGNILVSEAGNPKLLDFGIAKLLAPDGAGPNGGQGAATVLGTVPLTPGYASPEQVKGQAITTATDIYSLGVILYELLTGRRPYQLDTWSLAAWIAALEGQEPPRPSSVVMQAVERPEGGGEAGESPAELAAERRSDPPTLRRKLRGDLDRIVLKAMAKDPAERYGGVAELAEDLSLYREGLPIRSRPQTWSYRSGKFLRRHKLGVGVAGTFLALLLAFAATMTVQRQQIAAEKKRVTAERDRAQAVEQYLIGVFRVADPSRAGAEEITAREILDHGASGIEKNPDLPPATKATLLDVTGRVYRQLGLLEKARPLLERALAIRREALPPNSPEIAESLNNLTSLLRNLGEDDQVEAMLREAVEIQRRAVPPDDLQLATMLSNLASTLADRGKSAEAEALFREALALKRKTLPENHPEVAKTLNGLAVLRWSQGDAEAAEAMFRSVLAARRKLFGSQPQADLLTSLNNLATCLSDQGKFAEAEALFAEDDAMRQKLYPGAHAKRVLGLTNRAFFHLRRGDYAAADALLREALALAGKGKGNPADLAVIHRHQAVVFTHRPDLGDCEASAGAALEVFRAREDQPLRAADAESVLGACLASRSRYTEAEPLLLSGYRRLESLGGRRVFLTDARERLASFYRAWGKPAEAARYERAIPGE